MRYEFVLLIFLFVLSENIVIVGRIWLTLEVVGV